VKFRAYSHPLSFANPLLRLVPGILFLLIARLVSQAARAHDGFLPRDPEIQATHCFLIC
jgi:hypothetical protein